MQVRKHSLPILLTCAISTGALASASGSGEAGPGLTDQAAAGQSGGTDNTIIKTFYKDGLRFENGDKSFTMRLGAQIYLDSAFIKTNNDYENAFGREEDGTRFRVARVSAEGTVNEYIEYKWRYDFSGGVNNRFKDVYLGFLDTAIGNVRVGQFKEPFSLEQITPLGSITFMERSGADRLVPGRNVGLMAYDHNEAKTMTWAAGMFRDDGTDTGDDTGDGEYSLTARVTGTPMKDDATHLVHIGAALSLRHLRDSVYAVQYRGESNITQSNIAAVNIAADDVELIGLEAAWLNGPLSLQGEYVMTAVDPSAGSSLDFTGFYVLASYFLTGESRTYKDTAGAFSKVKVVEPYGRSGGKGAWEIAARISGLDLDDGAVSGGEVESYALGANWYLNDSMRVMFNYIHEEADTGAAGDGKGDILAVRLQLDV